MRRPPGVLRTARSVLRASATSVLSVVEKRSVLLREQRRQPLRHATPQRSLSPLLEPDLLRSLQVLEEPLLEGVREARVLDGDDVFVVQLLGADVHVGRADDAPGTVSDEKLGVQHGGLVLEDPDARIEQLLVVVV